MILGISNYFSVAFFTNDSLNKHELAHHKGNGSLVCQHINEHNGQENCNRNLCVPGKEYVGVALSSHYSGKLRADDFDNTIGGAPVHHQNSMWSR